MFSSVQYSIQKNVGRGLLNNISVDWATSVQRSIEQHKVLTGAKTITAMEDDKEKSPSKIVKTGQKHMTNTFSSKF